MKLNIAIIGTGSAGASSALYFTKNGHAVTVFEREEEPKPVGAGIMLQPTGLQCLREFGLDEKAISLGSKIIGMEGTCDDKKIIDLSFKNKDHLFGLGIHRGALFFLLFDKLIEEGIDVRLGAEIIEISGDKKKTLTDTKGNKFKDFDLVVVANGARSSLRKGLPIIKIERVQKYGALWSKIPFENKRFDDKIIQFYKGTHKMAGFMPIGKPTKESPEFVNFFWSIKFDEIENWKNNTSLDEWKSQILELAPDYADVIANLKSKDDVMIAPYMDVELKPSYHNNIVFIGDAAHPMSPQLSQGAGFAMLDSKLLSESIEKNRGNIQLALKKYHLKRSKQVYFYQKVSRIVTPMFQSDSNNTWIRNNLFNLFSKINPTKKIINNTLLGYRESVFGDLEKKYYKGNSY